MLSTAGAVLDGAIPLGISMVLVALFVSALWREPDSRLAWLTSAAVKRSHSLARLAAVSALAFTRAGVEVLGIRRRRRRLRHELRDRLAPLGEAVSREDRRRAESLKAQVGELKQALLATEREASVALGGARRQIERERAASEST